MSDLEEELKVMREKNNELVQKVQYWKMTAAQRENEKLDLMKEMNQLRLKLSRMRSSGAAQARKLDATLQATSEEALSHLVQASSAVARTIQFTKQYIQERQEAEASSPRWSSLSTVTPERVNKVPPLLLAGRSIQPVVQLRRASLNSARNGLRSPNQTRNVTERALPMHMLQDVYIPLTRIDTSNYPINYMESEASDDANNSTGDLGLPEETAEQAMEHTNNSSDAEDYDNSRRLDAVTEEPESDEPSPQRRIDNPLEGPSWLLDVPDANQRGAAPRATLEPDSTTELADKSTTNNDWNTDLKMEFTPTVRRRRRIVSPPARTPPQTESVCGRVLQVLLQKLPSTHAAPSPHGATDRTLIVLDSPDQAGGGGDNSSSPRIISTPRPSGDGHRAQNEPALGSQPTHRVKTEADTEPDHSQHSVNGEVKREVISETNDSTAVNGDTDNNVHESRPASWLSESHESDSDMSDRAEQRTRRKRKPVTYKEKPLNRKLRR